MALEKKKLYNGYEIPTIGFGTWQTPDGETATNSVKTALNCGYRHIDAAAVYGNEVSVGIGIKEANIDRSSLFITSKVWNTERGYDKTKKAFEKTLNDLQLDYLDLYLIHWPAVEKQFENWKEINRDTWQCMIDLYKEGRVKAIGVSNFQKHHLECLMDMEYYPMVNQIEIHAGMLQKEVREYCQKHNIVVEAWSPLGTGRMLDNTLLKEIAQKYGKAVAQVCIRWCLQNDVIPLPKSITASRIEENLKVFDFELQKEDMEKINAMEYFGGSGLDPDEVDF